MRRWIRLAIWLYPPEWRHRYGREFDALVDDINPGTREFCDVLKGALAMQIRTLGAIPVICALVGALAGGFVATRTPSVYSSTALILLRGVDYSDRESFLQKLDRPLSGVLGHSKEERAATHVDIHKTNSGDSFMRLSYVNRDSNQAQRVAARLAAAVVDKSTAPWTAVVIDLPTVPRLPVKSNYSIDVASGAIVGLLFGLFAVVAWQLRRWPRKTH